MTPRLHDLVFYFKDGKSLRGYVTRVSKGTTVDIAVHNDAGHLLFGVTDAELDTSGKGADGTWSPRE